MKFQPGDRVLVTSPPDCPEEEAIAQLPGTVREYATLPEGFPADAWPYPYIIDLDDPPAYMHEERDGVTLAGLGLLCAEHELWPEAEPVRFVPFSVGDRLMVDTDKWPVYPKGTQGVVTMIEPDGNVRVRPEGINLDPALGMGDGPVPFSYWANADSDYLHDLRIVLSD